MKYWKKMSRTDIHKRISEAMKQNLNYDHTYTIGIPGTKLDDHAFNDEPLFIKDSPYLQLYIQNPNHIGCHTYDPEDVLFGGTFDIERELIDLIGMDLLHGKDDQFDGYVTQGGTEANIQAMWVYRNYFKKEKHAQQEEIAIITSEDVHYSAPKGADLLNLDLFYVPVDFTTRKILCDELENVILKAKKQGKKYFIALCNMGTTMFGSVDDPNVYKDLFVKHHVDFKIHVDGAFGGFIYPIDHKDCNCDFSNPNVSSITLDGHKMLQAPYGTGIFICRKNLIHSTLTKEATYIENKDVTLSGSRSGANAIAIWMILQTYGPYGWMEKIHTLRNRAYWLACELHKLNIPFYKDPFMNIITIHANYIKPDIAHKYYLVPQTHTSNNRWYKIVVMDHVQMEHLISFIEDLKKHLLKS